MHNEAWAEWIISRLTNRRRASSIVGDLLEAEPRQGTLWFFVSVVRIVLFLAWRPITAFVAAFYVGLFWRREFMILAMRLPYQPRPTFWYLIVSCLRLGIPQGNMSELHFRAVWFGTVLWIAVAYAAIRYGIRDEFARLALGFTSLATIAVFFWNMPTVVVACVVLALCLFVASVRTPQRVRALAALTAAVVVAFWGGLLSMYSRAVLEDVLYDRLASTLSQRTVLFCFWLLAVWITTAGCSFAHAHFLQHDQSESSGRTWLSGGNIMNPTTKTILFGMLTVVLSVTLWLSVSATGQSTRKLEPSYSEFMSQVHRGNVKEVTLYLSANSYEIEGEYREPAQQFRVTIFKESSTDLTKELLDRGALMNVKAVTRGDWISFLMAAGLLILLAAFWISYVKRPMARANAPLTTA